MDSSATKAKKMRLELDGKNNTWENYNNTWGGYKELLKTTAISIRCIKNLKDALVKKLSEIYL